METKAVSGVYRHNTGKSYRVLHSTHQAVVYQALEEDCEVLTFPLADWTSQFELLTPEQINPLVDKIGLVFIRNRKVLMARSLGSNIFYIPGGKRETGETDLQCLGREIYEELGQNIIADTAQPFGIYYAQAHNKPSGSLIKMTCYMALLTGTPKASQEIEEIAWLGHKDRNKIANAAKLIFDDLYWKGLIR